MGGGRADVTASFQEPGIGTQQPEVVGSELDCQLETLGSFRETPVPSVQEAQKPLILQSAFALFLQLAQTLDGCVDLVRGGVDLHRAIEGPFFLLEAVGQLSKPLHPLQRLLVAPVLHE